MNNNLPKHTAIILDGNRRWAKSRGLAIWGGHAEGKNKASEISETAFALGIPYVTLWALSEDNIKKRDPVEIKILVSLLKDELKSRLVNRLFENQVRFRVIGKWRELVPDTELASLIDEIESKTQFFDNYNLTILFGYDGTTELVETIKDNLLYWDHVLSDELLHSNLSFDIETIRKESWLGELPPVDLIIRTGEEKDNWTHLSSGFMMLHTANSQIRSTKTLWPNFTKQELEKMIAEFSQRECRLGK